jgi:hypothetical protein
MAGAMAGPRPQPWWATKENLFSWGTNQKRFAPLFSAKLQEIRDAASFFL